jgi:hypothetical protein
LLHRTSLQLARRDISGFRCSCAALERSMFMMYHEEIAARLVARKRWLFEKVSKCVAVKERAQAGSPIRRTGRAQIVSARLLRLAQLRSM